MAKKMGIVEVPVPYNCKTCGYCIKLGDTEERLCWLLKPTGKFCGVTTAYKSGKTADICPIVI